MTPPSEDRLELLVATVQELTRTVESNNRAITSAIFSLVDGQERQEQRMDAVESRMEEHAQQIRAILLEVRSLSLDVRGLQYENRNILDVIQRRFGGESP